MNQPETRIYPIVLHNIPVVIFHLLKDSGVPVIQSTCLEKAAIASYHIHMADAVDSISLSTIVTNPEKQPILFTWQSLLKNHVNPIDFELNLDQSVYGSWTENGIALSEQMIPDHFRLSLLSALKLKLHENKIPWIQYSPTPAGYCGVLNFRIDIDEPEPDDWQNVIRELEPIQSGTTWFLSTQATHKRPLIYNWLKSHDVQSHGHWHHIHCHDPKLNRRNLQIAHQRLENQGFTPAGFAAPCGRLTSEIPGILKSLNYRFLAGIGGPDGFLPFRGHDNLWRIHCLPVSEGLYLERGLSHSDMVIAGYQNAAERAMKCDRPVFWYGHAERRLGRKPEIVREIVNYAKSLKNIWHVTLTRYLDWLEARNEIAIEVEKNLQHDHELKIQWKNTLNQSPNTPYPKLSIETNGRLWQVNLSSHESSMTLPLSEETSNRIDMPEPTEVLETHAPATALNLKQNVRVWLDWERETPVEVLRLGSWRSRLKAEIRSLTDNAWSRRFTPKSWPVTEAFWTDAA